MLRLSRFPQQPSRYNACFECLSKIHLPKSTTRPEFRISVHRSNVSRRLFSGADGRPALGEQSISESKHEPSVSSHPPRLSGFRQELQKWETENAVPSTHSTDEQGRSAFNVTSGFLDRDVIAPDDGVADKRVGETLAFHDNELLDLGHLRTFLVPGDLVELRFTSTPIPELAIFVRNLETQIQFYGMSGRYVHRDRTSSIRFFIPHFVTSEELEPLLPFLPSTDISRSLEDRLQNLQSDVPRDIGRPLVRKLAAFLQQSEVAYQSLASRLDHAHGLLADKLTLKNATLDEITNELVSPLLGPKQGDEYPAPVLFAVHRSISADDSGFRVSSLIRQRATIDYEIMSIKEKRDIKWVVQQVREYRDDVLNGTRKSLLHNFITKARQLIDESRESRACTASGRLGLFNSALPKHGANQHGKVEYSFSRSAESFLRFLESWVCSDSIRRGSPMNGIGYTILRAIDRYDESDLSETTGWTLLQEIGYISPWETKAVFDLRLPNVGRNVYPSLPSNSAESFVPDKSKDIRKDWADLPVFCVDDVGAQEIDDGFSIEDAPLPEEYWVHVHTADPAAHIDPKSPVATFAETLGGTVYLPDRTVPMLPRDFVHDRLSLAPGRPCLTFSARMNLEGDILENKVTAGMIRNVTFLTPATLNEITCGPAASATVNSESVFGGDMPTPVATRHLTQSVQLSESQKLDLERLHQITLARENQLFAKGRVIAQNFRPSVDVSLKDIEWQRPKVSTCVRYKRDPVIKITTPVTTHPERRVIKQHGNTVMSLMLLANEVAARWCNARGIPIPYRITPNNPNISELADYFRNTLLPAVDEAGSIHRDLFREYYNRAGSAVLSTSPGPHVQLAVKMTAKCTSPLRRYADLLLHWQVGAALLRESKTGESLIGNTKDDFLPFSKSKLDVVLAHLTNREMVLTYGMSEAQREWSIHFLLRLWESRDPSDPLLLNFLVRSVNSDGMIGGIIEEFFIGAQMDMRIPPPDWLSRDELKEGDRLEAVITRIDVHARSVIVRFLRPLGPR